MQYDSLLGQFQALQHEREELQARSISNRHPHPEYQTMRAVNIHIHPNCRDRLTTLFSLILLLPKYSI